MGFGRVIKNGCGEIRFMNKQKRRNGISTSTMTMVALMAAVLCVLAPFSIPIGPVPVSLATFGLYVAVIVLGTKKATVVCLMYLLIGFVGLPVFSGFSGGPVKLLGPTGGYLLGYLLLTVVAGYFVDKFPGKRGMCALGLVFGTAACYMVGTVWMAVQMELTFGTALLVGVIPFLIGDVVKIAIAVWIGNAIYRQINRAGIKL